MPSLSREHRYVYTYIIKHNDYLLQQGTKAHLHDACLVIDALGGKSKYVYLCVIIIVCLLSLFQGQTNCLVHKVAVIRL